VELDANYDALHNVTRGCLQNAEAKLFLETKGARRSKTQQQRASRKVWYRRPSHLDVFEDWYSNEGLAQGPCWACLHLTVLLHVAVYCAIDMVTE